MSRKWVLKKNSLPAVYIVNNPQCLGLGMHMVEIILHPCDKVVLERALDELVKESGVRSS